MAIKNDQKIDENVKLDTSKDVLDINKILPKRKSYRVLILSSFLQKLREDKLYFICFVITIFAFVVFSTNKVQESDGALVDSKDKVVNNVTNKLNEDKFDVSKYVGYYVKNFKLDSPIKYGECLISEYDYVYVINKDNSIVKYMHSKCTGKVLIHKDILMYVNSENTRNIGSKRHVYMFKDDKITELDGFTYVKSSEYKLNEEIKIDNVNVIFYNDKFILEGLKELYLVNGKSVETKIEFYSLLSKGVFKTSSGYEYFVYNIDETLNCYVPSMIAAVDFEDKDAYTIYSVTFDLENLSFSEPVVKNVRKRSDGCDVLNDDLALTVN